MNNEKKIQGKRNRAKGLAFEKKVRADLVEKGWIVDKWSNNVEWTVKIDTRTMIALEDSKGKLIPAKHKFSIFVTSCT